VKALRGVAPFCAAAATLLSTPSLAQAESDSEGAAFYRQFEACRQTPGEISRLRCFDALTAPGAERSAPEVLLVEELSSENRPGAGDPPPDQTLDKAQAEQREARLARLESLSRKQERGMLSADDPNYIVYAQPVDDEIGDENHMEFYVSLKYPIVDDWFEQSQNAFGRWENAYGDFFNAVVPDRMLFHYNGLYDFYITDSDRYDSAPIVSRRQNPGVSFEYDFSRGRNTLRVGWFHESNGQTLEEDEVGRFEARRARFGDDFALAEVSRGWDYAQLRWASNTLLYEDPRKENWFNYQIEARWYCNCQGFGFIGEREDEIWWDAGNNSEITDFDGLRGMLERPLWRSDDGRTQVDARLDLQTGLENSFAQYLSARLTLAAEWDNVRLMLFYFDGYGRDPSTYHLRTQYAGLGLELR